MAGYGSSPFGAFPAGFALPATATDPPDPPENARYLDFLTRDYILADDGELERMPIVRQRVLLTLSTIRGSSTVLPDFGVSLPGIIDAQFEAAVRSEVRRGLNPLIVGGVLKLTDVPVDTSDVVGRSKITVEYEDLSTLDSDKVEI